MTKNKTNRRVLLARPPQGAPRPDDFTVADEERPKAGEGEVLLRNLSLSLDPYMLGRMNDRGESYAAPYALGEPPGGRNRGRGRLIGRRRLPFLNGGARVRVCGLVFRYNGDVVADGGLHDLIMSLIVKRIRMEGFMIGDHYGGRF